MLDSTRKTRPVWVDLPVTTRRLSTPSLSNVVTDCPPPLMKQYWTLPLRGFYRLTNSSEEPVPLPTSARVQLSGPVVDKLIAQRSAWLIVNGNPISRPRSIAAFQQAAREHGLDLYVRLRRRFGDVLVVFVMEDESLKLTPSISDR